MSDEPQKVQVVEVIGTKLDPDSSYIIAYRRGTITRDTGRILADVLEEKFRVKVVVLEMISDDLNKDLRLFSIPLPGETLTPGPIYNTPTANGENTDVSN